MSLARCLFTRVEWVGTATNTERHVHMPMIAVSGYADVPMAVRAIKAGAADFVEKPFRCEELLVRVRECLAGEFLRRRCEAWQKKGQSRLASLSPREKEVMKALVAGKRNKEIAAYLHLSTRTVESHRASLMENRWPTSSVSINRSPIHP